MPERSIANSEAAFFKARQLMPGGVSSPVRAFRAVGGTPLFLKHGEGCMVTDVDGNVYVDYVASYGPLIAGHANGLLAEAGSGALTLGTPSSPGIPRSVASCTLLAPYNDLAATRELFRAYAGQIACMIVEPVAGNMGVVPPAEGYLGGLRAL